MSATTLGEARVQAAARPTDTPVSDTNTPAVKWWATLGVVVVAFAAYVLIKWVTGPYFKHVAPGPTHVPTWMHIELTAWQIVSWPAALFLLFWFVVRPWVRERRVGVDGILLIGFALMWFQDPLSSAGNHWFVYNASMVNFGSWANSVPGFVGWGQPGHMTSEPILFTPAAYIYIMLIAAAAGCASMRWARRRWPRITTAGLVAWCYVTMCVFDLVLEGLIWLPLGVFEYPGGHWSLFPSTYHKYPLNEMLTIGLVFTAISCLRFFLNDKGQMWIERGVDKVRGGAGRKVVFRGLAAIGAIQLIMFLGYNVPNTAFGFNSTTWPKALQERSYFTNGICGAGTNRFCPGPQVANMRVGAAYIGADGKVVVPKGKTLPTIVPFIK
jgi:Spirocyclase AveC-like